MVAIIIIKQDGSAVPVVEGNGDLKQWETVREAREYFDRYALGQVGEMQCVGLSEFDQKTTCNPSGL